LKFRVFKLYVLRLGGTIHLKSVSKLSTIDFQLPKILANIAKKVIASKETKENLHPQLPKDVIEHIAEGE